jgi:hypothetical protein
MSTQIKFIPGLIMVLVFQWMNVHQMNGQAGRWNRSHTFAPLPPLLETKGLPAEESLQKWEGQRRSEILDLFRKQMYGVVPSRAVRLESQTIFINKMALEGRAEMKEVEVTLVQEGESLTFTMLILLPPERTGPVPLFLGLNFYGNQTVLADPEISLTGSWVGNNRSIGIEENRATEESRGTGSQRWPVDLILSRGYGLATIYAGDIDPDFDDGFRNGVHGLFPLEEAARGPESWGTIAAWAWGLSRALDYLETDPDVDGERVAVLGHSRMGKAAMWAGAQDPRFALVISNNSGCGGAALSRRAHGERVQQINERFTHWFADRFNSYSENEKALPVDQHMLVALMAPRPLYVASAEEDEWADPYGEYLSLYYGSEAYEWYGNPAMSSDRLPEVDRPVTAGKLGYHIRTGGHDLTRYDWERYLDFADLHLSGRNSESYAFRIDEEWIRAHLKKESPRLILTPEVESLIGKRLLANDPLTAGGLALMRKGAEAILETEPLAYEKRGRRLLGVSREALHRLSTLALVYRIEKEPVYLQRLEEEMRAVCTFNDWNPSHFLDVAEMAAGVALALDWAGEWLSPEVAALASQSIREKALEPALRDTANTWWIEVRHNWNLVCHGGLSLAALAVYEDDPGLASGVLSQAVEHIPLALEPYAPSGVYPEGPSYWFYATSYLTLSISAFESALGTGFGFIDSPGVRESALFSQVLAGPSGEYFNYFDASLGGFHSLEHTGLLSWFANQSGSPVDLESYGTLIDRHLQTEENNGIPRLFPVYFLYTVQADRQEIAAPLPGVWTGFGEEPVAVFRDPDPEGDGFYLAAKGGRAADNHGNMDAGSFIFELSGVRWSLDPGNQDYFTLEQLMGQALWESDQNSRRWTLLTKNNYGHSTLTVNGVPHLVDGRASLVKMDRRDGTPEVTFDLTEIFGANSEGTTRTFKRISDRCVRITDRVLFSPSFESVTWQMMTRAEVLVRNHTIYLRQEENDLAIYILTGAPAEINVVELDPPPLAYDKRIPGLKRIEITWQRDAFNGPVAELTIELNSNIYLRR